MDIVTICIYIHTLSYIYIWNIHTMLTEFCLITSPQVSILAGDCNGNLLAFCSLTGVLRRYVAIDTMVDEK